MKQLGFNFLLISSLFGATYISNAMGNYNASKVRPNIVFIFSDDHATQAVSAYGHEISKIAQTPHIDHIAEQGIRFDRCLVGNSICGPSRATILTGTYSHINKFYSNERTKFDGSQPTFPKILQNVDYQTALIGKWHLASDPTGFDHWEILPGQGSYYNPDFLTPAGKHREEGYVSELITGKAITWLEEQRETDKPFLLMVQHKAPHRDWSPAPKYLDLFDDITFPEPDSLFDDYEGRGSAARDQDMTIEKSMLLGSDLKVDAFYTNRYNRMNEEQIKIFQAAYIEENTFLKENQLSGDELVSWKYQRYLKDYLRCVKSVDDCVGEVWTWLEDHDLLDNTIFIYSSDQGFYLGEHGWFDKRFMYDESYRTPLVMSWPGVIEPGTVSKDLVSNLDFAQTFLEAAGATAHPRMQGESLFPILLGDSSIPWRDSHYYHYYEYPGWHMVYRHEGVYDGRYKLMHFYDIDEWEMYDCLHDPKEMRNCYNDTTYKLVKERLHKELVRLRDYYDVPPNEPKETKGKGLHYHSNERKARTGDRS